MSEQIEQRKLVFFIDSTVRSPFSMSMHADPNKPMILSSTANIVKEGEVIATAILEKDMAKYSGSYDIQPFIQLGEGKNVAFDSHTYEYRALCYGFARVSDTRKIEVQPLIFPTKTKLQGFMYIYQTKSYEFPTVEDIKKVLEYENIMYPLKDEDLQKQLDRITMHAETLEGTRILVARGVKEKNGQIEHVIMLRETERKVGTLRGDGSMDFKERDFYTKVKQNDVICELKPYIPPQNGYTIYGEPISGKLLGEKKFKIGKNLVPSEQNEYIYVAGTDGVMQVDTSNKITVENKVYIKKDVDLNTGNLNINGSVEIGGSVQPGFHVKATGSIIVNKSIEDASVEADGDVIVNHGIIGKDKDSCFIKAGGSVQAKFIQNAKVSAGHDVQVKESIVQCDINAKNVINVGKNVVGGQVVGKNGLEVGVAGSTSFIKTLLIAGRDIEIEEKIAELNKQIKNQSKVYKEHIEDMKMQFGENFLRDLTSFVTGLIGQRKIKFIGMLKTLKEHNAVINNLTQEREELKESIFFPKPPTIIIKEKIYPETYIQIRNSIKKIDKENDSTSYREDPELKVII